MKITAGQARAAQLRMDKVIADLKSIRLFLRRDGVDELESPVHVYLAEAADRVHDAADALRDRIASQTNL